MNPKALEVAFVLLSTAPASICLLHSSLCESAGSFSADLSKWDVRARQLLHLPLAGRAKESLERTPAELEEVFAGARPRTRHRHSVDSMDDDPLTVNLGRMAVSVAARMLDAGLDTHFKTSLSDVVVVAADHPATDARAAAI